MWAQACAITSNHSYQRQSHTFYGIPTVYAIFCLGSFSKKKIISRTLHLFLRQKTRYATLDGWLHLVIRSDGSCDRKPDGFVNKCAQFPSPMLSLPQSVGRESRREQVLNFGSFQCLRYQTTDAMESSRFAKSPTQGRKTRQYEHRLFVRFTLLECNSCLSC